MTEETVSNLKDFFVRVDTEIERAKRRGACKIFLMSLAFVRPQDADNAKRHYENLGYMVDLNPICLNCTPHKYDMIIFWL